MSPAPPPVPFSTCSVASRRCDEVFDPTAKAGSHKPRLFSRDVVPLDIPLFTSVLKKKSVSAQYLKNWKTRVVTLSSGPTGWKVVWKEQGAEEVKGELLLSPDASITVDPSFPTRFVVVSSGHELVLECKSRREKMEWIQHLCSIRGNGTNPLSLDVRDPVVDLQLDFTP